MSPLPQPGSATFEHNDWNQALGARLVVGKRRPDLRHFFVKTVALVAALKRARAGFELLGLLPVCHLDLNLRVFSDVPEPRRVLRSPALRGDDDVVVTLAAVDQRRRDGLAAFCPL